MWLITISLVWVDMAGQAQFLMVIYGFHIAVDMTQEACLNWVHIFTILLLLNTLWARRRLIWFCVTKNSDWIATSCIQIFSIIAWHWVKSNYVVFTSTGYHQSKGRKSIIPLISHNCFYIIVVFSHIHHHDITITNNNT